jgi:hypothetical protein
MLIRLLNPDDVDAFSALRLEALKKDIEEQKLGVK